MRRVWQIALWVIGNGKFPEGVKVKSGALHAKRSEPRTSGYPRLSRGCGVSLTRPTDRTAQRWSA